MASLVSRVHLARAYAPLIETRPRQVLGDGIWLLLLLLLLLLHIFVTIQLGWTLRPFVGSPGMPTTFFREGVWANAYVVVLRDIWTRLST